MQQRYESSMTSTKGHPKALRVRLAETLAAGAFLLGAAMPARAAFLVEIFEVDGSLKTVDAALAAANGTPDSVALMPVLDLFDGYRNQDRGLFPGASLFPGNADTTFALRARSRIAVPEDGTYTFATGGDDGVRLSVGGQVVIDDPSPLHPYRLLGAEVFLSAGAHDLELVFFENYGHAQLEFMYALGATGLFDGDTHSLDGTRSDLRDSFALVGASAPEIIEARSALSAAPVPVSPALWLFGFGLCALWAIARPGRVSSFPVR